MNVYYYLFYKLSCFLNKKDNNEWGVMYALSLLVFINIIILYVFVFRITEANSKGGYKIGILIIGIILFIINYILFLHKNRYKQIVKRYNIESLRRRKIGSFLVILYIVLTLASIILIWKTAPCLTKTSIGAAQWSLQLTVIEGTVCNCKIWKG